MGLSAAAPIFFRSTLPPIIQILETLNRRTGLSYFLKVQSLNPSSPTPSEVTTSETFEVGNMGNELYMGKFSCQNFKREIVVVATEKGFYLETFSSSLYFFCSIISALVELGGEMDLTTQKRYSPEWKDEKWDVSQLPKEALRGRRKQWFFNKSRW